MYTDDTLTCDGKYLSLESSSMFWNWTESCKSTPNLVLLDGILQIDNNVFKGCGFHSATFPSSLDYLGENAFSECSSLTSITLYSDSQLTYVGGKPFSNTKLNTLSFVYHDKYSESSLTEHVWKLLISSIENLIISADITSLPYTSQFGRLTSITFENPSFNSNNVPDSLKLLTHFAFGVEKDKKDNLSFNFSSFSSLTAITIKNSINSITSDAISSLTNLESLNLNIPCHRDDLIENFNSSYKNIKKLILYPSITNCTSLPTHFDNLTSLKSFDCHLNKDLKFDINKLLKSNLEFLDVSDTQIFGIPSRAVTYFICNNSCVSASCNRNMLDNCDCNLFNLLKCPDYCEHLEEGCTNCKELPLNICNQSRICKSCSSYTDGKCLGCTFNESQCNDDVCSECFNHTDEVSCNHTLGCSWCEIANICSDSCANQCNYITEESNCIEPCQWCSSRQFCRSKNSKVKCYPCDFYSQISCPLGCTSCSSDSNRAVLLIIIIVIIILVLILGCLIALFVFFKYRKRQNIPSNSNVTIQFNDLNENKDTVSNSLDSFMLADISEYIKCSKDIISFSSGSSVLLLNKDYSENLNLTNTSSTKLTYELIITGIKEKHSLIFNPSSFTLSPGATQLITIQARFRCSTDLTNAHANISCKVIDSHLYNHICKLNVLTETTPLISIDDITLSKEIGAGSYGKVYAGLYHGSEVAIKKFSLLTVEDNNNEAQTYSKLHSPYIVTFYGINPTFNYLIIEFCKFGSVAACYSNPKMNDKIKMLICYDCAMGMNYLHSCNIIHRDLKPENLLMISFSKDINVVRAKLSDFGTSRSSSETMKMTSRIGTPAFMAPEVFDGDEYGKKSDVYSYGMTVWSIYSEKTPLSDISNINSMFVEINNGKRPDLDSSCPLNHLIEQCWDKEPIKRPLFNEIIETLKANL